MLLHLLFFLGLSYVWVFQSKPEEKSPDYIPSYAYHEKSSSAAFQEKSAPTPNKTIPTSKNGIQKPDFNTRSTKFNQVMDISSAKNGEPVHLIGDNKKVPQPLIILLGKALTAKLSYPKAAIDLTVKGISVIGFILHPDGHVTDVQLLKSSRADILDQAALEAAREISPVKNVEQYVKEPKPIVFGIIFGESRE
jgi:TonB family protein